MLLTKSATKVAVNSVRKAAVRRATTAAKIIAAGVGVGIGVKLYNEGDRGSSNIDKGESGESSSSTTIDGSNAANGTNRSGDIENNDDNSKTKEQRSREKGKRFKGGDNALEQLDEIERAQANFRQGVGDKVIDNIEKSQQRARHSLKPHNLDFD